MTFNEFLNQAWSEHASQPSSVASGIPEGIKLIETGEHVSQMANLVTHVFGDHLQRWDDGIATLVELRKLPVFEAGSENEKTIARSIASLELASGKKGSLEEFTLSDQIRINAIAASTLSQADAEKAQAYFRSALEKAQHGLSKEDPANRALAVTGNNLAGALEEKSARNDAETELMILAAQTGRKFWEVAGTWLQVERAEYRLSRVYLSAGDVVRALEHAQLCLEISRENDAPATELFFGYEALGLAEKARGNQVGFAKAVELANSCFEKLGSDDKAWCEISLKKLTQ